MAKTKTSFEQLENVLEIAPAPVSRVIEAAKSNAVVKNEVKEKADPEELANEARQVYRRIIQKGEDLLDDLSEVARGSESARDFEVANGILKTVAETAKMLETSAVKMQKNEVQGNTNNVQQNVFVGDSETLMKMIRGGKEKFIEADVL
jgi:DNA mismatch repair ATPase MutS